MTNLQTAVEALTWAVTATDHDTMEEGCRKALAALRQVAGADDEPKQRIRATEDRIKRVLEKTQPTQVAPQTVIGIRRSLGWLVQKWAEDNKIIIGPHTAVSLADALAENGYIHSETSAPQTVSRDFEEIRFRADLFRSLYDGFGFIDPDSCDTITDTTFEILKAKGYLPTPQAASVPIPTVEDERKVREDFLRDGLFADAWNRGHCEEAVNYIVNALLTARLKGGADHE